MLLTASSPTADAARRYPACPPEYLLEAWSPALEMEDASTGPTSTVSSRIGRNRAPTSTERLSIGAENSARRSAEGFAHRQVYPDGHWLAFRDQKWIPAVRGKERRPAEPESRDGDAHYKRLQGGHRQAGGGVGQSDGQRRDSEARESLQSEV